MYKISVPITNRSIKRAGKEKLLEMLREFNAEHVFKQIMQGGKNIYRDAYIKANGDAFREFA